MKLTKSIIVVFAIVSLLTSCFSDLDPKDLGSKAVTSATVYKTTGDYLSGLAKLYASFAVSGQQGPSGNSDISGLDEGFGVYLRELWNCQELTTDEAVIAWNDQTVKNFHWQNWTANDVFIAAMYSREMYTVTISNEFIRVTSGSTDPEIKRYNAEARFIRALAYWHTLDMFGNPPFVTEADKAGAFNPKQTTRAELFAYLDSELTAIESELGAPGFEYGRTDQAALWMLQAKLYLNAEVYINTPKYTEALTALNKIFASGKYSLVSNYILNFSADNHTSTEIIFPITYDGAHTQSYGGMDYIIHAQIGGSMTPANFGLAGGWGGTRTTSSFVGKFSDPSGATDKRAQFYTPGQSLAINDIGTFTDGYAIKKFSNLTAAGGPSASGVPDFVDTDYPMFRLADAYLMYAEAVLRQGTGGTAAQALTYVNQVISRAYGNTSANINSGQLTLDFILDERGRELYWEGHRRTDLIRYGLFTGGTYLWPWKGNAKNGIATDAFRNLFPIPTADITANPTLNQNTGY